MYEYNQIKEKKKMVIKKFKKCIYYKQKTPQLASTTDTTFTEEPWQQHSKSSHPSPTTPSLQPNHYAPPITPFHHRHRLHFHPCTTTYRHHHHHHHQSSKKKINLIKNSSIPCLLRPFFQEYPPSQVTITFPLFVPIRPFTHCLTNLSWPSCFIRTEFQPKFTTDFSFYILYRLW